MLKTNIIVFAAVLIACAAAVTCFPRDERVIEQENRSFNYFPEVSVRSILSGDFARGLEDYLSDRVAFRADVTALARALEDLRGVEPPDPVRITSTTIAADGRIMEIFRKREVSQARYAEVVNAYRAALPDNTRVFVMLAPTQLEFQHEKYSSLQDSQNEAIEYVYARLADGVTPVDAYGAIAAHAGEYAFFRTDHHWTQLGAYYAYTAFADAAGFAPLPLDAFERRELYNFIGYLQGRMPDVIIEPDTIEYYVNLDITTEPRLFYPPAEGNRSTYGVFLGGDHAERVIRTSTENGRTAVVIKDSYANAFIPFLAAHYETIVILDPRHFDGSAVRRASRYEDVDLVFMNYVFTATFADLIEAMNGIR